MAIRSTGPLSFPGLPCIVLALALHHPVPPRADALALVNLASVPRPAESPRSRTFKSTLFSAPEATTADAPSISAEAKEAETPASLSPRLEGVWTPPSRNVEQRRGNVFSIQRPEDLLDFVIEDERLCVVKVYATWCKTCKAFDMRYRKLASQFGDKYDDDAKTGKSPIIAKKGCARFAEMKFEDDNEEVLYALLNTRTIPLPYILMYKGSKGMVRGFQCTPKKIGLLTKAVEELADSAEVAGTNGVTGRATEAIDNMPGISSPSATTTTSARGLGATDVYLSKLSTRHA